MYKPSLQLQSQRAKQAYYIYEREIPTVMKTTAKTTNHLDDIHSRSVTICEALATFYLTVLQPSLAAESITCVINSLFDILPVIGLLSNGLNILLSSAEW